MIPKSKKYLILMNEYSRASILEAVLLERERQDALWGDQSHHPDEWWNVIATEENGEVAREGCPICIQLKEEKDNGSKK